ncbi:hypothetical protein [Dongia sedimenti]|uniref:Uncharacterized protein n=1 Tax=Dongia sedimenti TaxID=3064282 RepID=A0ABU0YV96_9PROT|nr:hypothetical protein [Rhodospirillaceae bacterium R-7]
MARVSIYVSETLKAKMDRFPGVNWSDEAQLAFQQAIAREGQKRKPDMQAAIERLRASKEKSMKDGREDGHQAGREWAEKKAEYAELRRIADIDLGVGVEHAFGMLRMACDPQKEATDEEIIEDLSGDLDIPTTDEWVAGFIEGAQEFFEEVEDQL